MHSSEQTDIQITEAAARHIAGQLQQTQARYLRLGVKESGCNGYMYMLDYLEAPEPDDHCYAFGNDVQLCVRESDMAMVQGTEIDMITQGLNSALVFKNPKATSYCGCGESFAVGAEGSGQAMNATDAAQAEQLATDVGAGNRDR